MSTITIQCDSGDCYADKNNNFSDGSGGVLYVIDNPGVSNANTVTWIPFTIPLRRVTILQAYFKLTPSYGQSSQNYLYLACEDADNPSAPTTGADVNSRVMTSNQVNLATGTWTPDVEKTYQMDNPVQEVLNRSGWQAGNTLAVMLYDNGTIGDVEFQCYSYEGDLTKRPRLQLNFLENNSNASWWI